MQDDSGARTDFRDAMDYADYLALDRVLDAQRPLSDAHDELLFIIQHQTSELWMKLALHEIDAAIAAIEADDLAPAMKGLSRLARIFEQLNSAWDVLRTMTPADYTRFRDRLGASSGFQSWQYRALEFACGQREAGMLKPHAHRAEVHAALAERLARPSIYDAAIGAVARAGFPVAEAVAARDRSRPHQHDESVEAAWLSVYRDTTRWWRLYELAEKLVDMEDYFRRWRFNHVTTVERVIGFKRGTGGTAGVPYLRRMTQVVLFPELWTVRTKL
jgi:tryptophan 2,3-dioxygenase